MNSSERIYVCAPLKGGNPTVENITLNIRRAHALMCALLRQGYNVFCPHTMWGGAYGALPENTFLALCLNWLYSCTTVALPGLTEPGGNMLPELGLAATLGKRIMYWDDDTQRLADLPKGWLDKVLGTGQSQSNGAASNPNPKYPPVQL